MPYQHLLVAFSILLLSVPGVKAQQNASISGTVSDTSGEMLYSASIGIEGTTLGTVTNEQGYFSLSVPANQDLKLVVYFLGFESYETIIKLKEGESRQLTIKMNPESKILEDVEVFGISQRENTLIPINIKSIDQLPNSSGNIETLIKTLPGVTSGNELSSQYSVRGGSFDENLIYVNDIEIYRPMLIQSAQQEGLSFVNPSLVSSIQFSAGGFDAEYGDKLSSVLDIRYKQPTELRGSASASMLGGSAHIEGSGLDNRLSYISGIRYKTTKFLLGTLDTKGDYHPSFLDFQTYVTYDITPKLELSGLGNFANNRFSRVPMERETNFGNLQQSYLFTVFYEGEEKDRFDTYLGALALNYHPSEKLSMKVIASGFYSDEAITYDLLKQYLIGLATQGSSGLRDSLVNIGVGSTLEHARNYLNYTIYSLEHKGTLFTNGGVMKWGIKAQQEIIDDQIREWKLLDSSGYSLPYSNEHIYLYDVYESANHLNNYRFASFFQYSHTLENPLGKYTFTLGARTQYWSFNKEVTVSPRGNFSYVPSLRSNIIWHVSAGLYHQPPFYKELRDQEGSLYPDRKAQRALHIVSGMDINFKLWHRPFVFTSEVYYKQMTRVIPYKLDDVRLQYLPQYDAKAYAMGIDFRIYGEFVPGDESWFSLSFQRTREDIYNDYIVRYDGTLYYPDYYRRPTDQFMNFAVFFQDHLPTNPNYKAHILLNVGTGLPYSGPFLTQPAVTYKLDPYRRIDIGFSRIIVRNTRSKFGIKSLWISAEILNLLNAKNMVSLDWVRTVESEYGVDVYFAVPNYLTGIAFNLKLSANFN